MATTIEQQVVMDEVLVPSTERCPFFKAFLVTADEDFMYQVKHKNHKKSNEMYYPRFTKVIIHHFMSKDPSIPRRNKVNWHYVRDDFLFLTIKVVSRHQNTQQHGAMLHIELTNDEIRNTKAYKEYYAFATREATPKPKASARRKKSGSDTSITPLTVAVTPKLTTAAKGKQAAKATKAKSPSAPSEPGGSGIDEGTGSKPGVPDVPTDESKEELSWNSSDDEGADDQEKVGDDDERDDDDEDQEVAKNDDKDDTEESGDDDEEGSIDEEDDNEETKDDESFDSISQTPKSSEDEGVGKEDQGLNIGEEERHDEKDEEDELYRDVNINQGRGLQASLEIEDSHVTLTLVKPDESIFETASTYVAPLPIPAPPMSHSTIAIITTTSQAPILPTPIPSEFFQNLPTFASVFRFNDRLKSLEEYFSEVMQINQFAGAVFAIPGIFQHFMYQRMSEAVQVAVQLQSDRLCEEAQKENDEFLRTVDENIKKIIKEQALVDAYESDKIILDTYGETVTLKRRRDDDEDKDEEPSAGPEQGSKRHREGKEPVSASSPSETASKHAGRSTTGSRSRQASTSESAFAEEPLQTTSQMEEPSHLEFKTDADDQPIVQSSQHPEWFFQPQKPPTSDCDWNKTLPAVYESIQPWISELAKQADSRSSFNELLDTPLDFSNFIMNRLRVNTLTPELLAGPTYELMKGSCKSLIELEYHLEEVYKATTDQLDWVNPEGDLKRLRLQDIEDMLLLLVQGKLSNLTVEERFAFNVSLRMFTRSIVIQRRVEDLQLGVESYQKRLNLTKPDTYRFDLKQREAYTAYSNPRGFIYQNKDKKNRLMRIDELHKFSDETLNDVRTALDNRLKGIRMRYLPHTIWRKSDNDRAVAMIQAIDKMLKTRRVLRILERFVGGRLYEGDFRMLQRTI
nr:hypothetical protein [Tanacetum cinerariifolium]